jgi:hypothetical protein
MSIRNQLDRKITNELIMMTRTVLEQNYFTFKNETYFQLSGLSMGAPSSGIFSEIYLQNLEHTKIIDILTQHNTVGYFRYVDDILIVYDVNLTVINKVHETFNNLTPTIKFTLETETDHNINFLDVSIHNKGNQLTFNIHHKPTTTDVIIPVVSCHPPERKHTAIRHVVNRMNSYRLNYNDKITEQHIIEKIIGNNGYDTSIIQQLNKPRHENNLTDNKKSWAKFTFFRGKTRIITKRFKGTNLRIAYKV